MGVVVLRVEEVDVVGGDNADPEPLPQLQRALDHLELARVEVGELELRRGRHVWPRLHRLVEHHLERVVVAEEVAVPGRGTFRGGRVVRGERLRHLAGDAGRGAHQPLVVALEEPLVDARTVVEAVDAGLGDQLDEVVVAGQVLRVQAEVVAELALVAAEVVAGGGDVGLAAEDGLDRGAGELAVDLVLLRPALVVEALEREQVAVVGDGKRLHAQPPRLLHERHDLALPVEQRIGGMKV